MNYYRNDIRIVKGDTWSNTITIENLDQELETIYFTCRDSLNDNSEALFVKSLDHGISLIEYDQEHDIRKYALRIAPADTKDLQSGTYNYDLELGVNGDIFTIMRGKFILEQDSSRGGN